MKKPKWDYEAANRALREVTMQMLKPHQGQIFKVIDPFDPNSTVQKDYDEEKEGTYR